MCRAARALGPLASDQAGQITAVLDARIADRPRRAQACRLAVLALDQDQARRTVVERLERQHPNRSRHLFQEAEVVAALRALAAFRCETCLPPIVAALQEPWLATAATWELGRIRPSRPLPPRHCGP